MCNLGVPSEFGLFGGLPVNERNWVGIRCVGHVTLPERGYYEECVCTLSPDMEL